MEEIIRLKKEKAVKKNIKELYSVNLINEINTVYMLMKTAALKFDFFSDHDLIESCIYEMESLKAKYRYLLKEAKSAGIEIPTQYYIQEKEAV